MKQLVDKIEHTLSQKGYVVLAIDGMAASGKTTLAEALSRKFSSRIVHTDDFFLPFNLREGRKPGDNIHYERFCEQVSPYLRKWEIRYRCYDCATGDYGDKVKLAPAPLTIVEGCYSLHPGMGYEPDISVFLKVDRDEQIRRLRLREEEISISKYLSIWIPMEEQYFAIYNPIGRASFIL